jgi:hypothetical protein
MLAAMTDSASRHRPGDGARPDARHKTWGWRMERAVGRVQLSEL